MQVIEKDSKIFGSVVKKIEKNRDIRENGGVVSIPWNLPRLSKVLPGVRKGQYTCITAATKNGKTQLTDFLFMYQPIEWLLDHPETNISMKIKYFSLELSKETKMAQAICYRLFTRYGIVINPDNLMSVFDEYVVEDEILDIIKSDEFIEWFDFFEETVEFIDHIRHPTGIHMFMNRFAEENGTWEYKEIDWENEDGSISKRTVKSKYIPNDPDQIVVPIIDHVGLLYEKGLTKFQAIEVLSSKYLLRMRDKLGYSPVIVQQQSAQSTTQQFTTTGNSILDRVRPTREGLADNKSTGLDVNLMLGIFSPYLYGEVEYNGWDLTQLRDNHREVSIMLNRNGKSNASIDLYFNGATNYFRELPREPDNKVYKFAERLRKAEEHYG